ncbi:MAG: TIGR02281 family clan AA aspartic protease [Granulosicoccaceae bacterium]
MSSDTDPENPTSNSGKIGNWMFIALFWLGLLGVGGWFGWQWEQKRLATHIPQALKGSRTGISVQATRLNHFVVEGLVNGHPVTFLVDTGATDVSIPASIAQSAGLKGGRWVEVTTANGIINVQNTRIDELKIGPLVLNSVGASINPRDSEAIALLGMSFLSYFELIQRDGTLEISVP